MTVQPITKLRRMRAQRQNRKRQDKLVRVARKELPHAVRAYIAASAPSPSPPDTDERRYTIREPEFTREKADALRREKVLPPARERGTTR